MSEYNEVDKVPHPEQSFDEVIEQVKHNIECTAKERPKHISYDELMQFKRGHFYHQWWHRFRRLGTVGVIAIPNTTMEDWLVFLEQYMRAFQEDYNRFKELVCQALNLHEEHLRIIDGVLEDHEDRIKEIERQLVEIWKEIQRITEEINNIKNELTQINNKIENLENTVNNLQQQINQLKNANNKLIQNLINSGAWEGTIEDGNLKPDRNIATGNINFFGGSTDGGSFIRTNNGQTENDVTAGI